MTKTIVSWSPTKLLTFLSCQRQFFYRYICGIEEEKTMSMTEGILTHEEIERDILSPIGEREYYIYPPKGKFSKSISKAKRLLLSLLENTQREGEIDSIEIEKEYREYIRVRGIDIALKSILDIIVFKRDYGVVLVDIKTKSSPLYNLDYYSSWNIQLSFYSLILSLRGYNSIERYILLVTPKDSKLIKLTLPPFDILSLICSSTLSLLSMTIPPPVSIEYRYCPYCQYRSLCQKNIPQKILDFPLTFHDPVLL